MNKKLVFISMLIVSLALCFFSCEEPAPFAITITGIPNNSSYNYGFVGLRKGSDTVAVSLPVPITNGKFTGELLNAESAAAFADKGTYMVILAISSDNRGQNISWGGFKLNTKVDGDISLSYTQFTYSASGSILLNK